MVDFNLDGFKTTYKDFARSYLFECKLGNSSYWTDKNAYQVKTTSLPSTTIDEVTADWQGHKYKLASTPTYDDFTMTFNMAIDGELRKKFLTWSVFLNDPMSNLHGVVDNASGSYFSDITLKQLDGLGAAFHEYRLDSAWPKTVGEVSLDYSNKEIASFDVTFAYQYHEIIQ